MIRSGTGSWNRDREGQDVSRDRSARRLIVLALVILLGIGSPASTLLTPTPVHAADPDLPSLSMPSDADLANDATLSVPEAPDPPAPVDAQGYIDGITATADTLPAADWDIDALVASLDGDVESAFSFVRDRIRFDPYPGVLRGAIGTLSARAGNADDRALLLAALLKKTGLDTRFAFADLDPATSSSVLARAFDEPSSPLPDGREQSIGEAYAEAVAARAHRDYALLRGALGDRAIGTSGQDRTAQLLADVSRHTWVQVRETGGWVDLDPTMADSKPGDTLMPAARTADAILDAERQSVSVRVVAETLVDGTVTQNVVLDERLDAATAAGSQILLMFTPDSGGGLLGGVGAPATFVPLLMVNGERHDGSSFAIAGDDGGFGLGGGSSIDLTGLLLEVETDAPDHEPLIHDRVLLDRIPAAIRATGSVTPEQLLPMPAGDAGPMVLGELHHISVSSGGANPRDIAIEVLNAEAFAVNDLGRPDALQQFSISNLIWPLTAAGDAMALASERFVVAGLDGTGARVFVGRPRVTIFSVGSGAAEAGFGYRSDLALDGVDVVRRDGPDPVADATLRMWYGVLQTALEAEYARVIARGAELSADGLVGVSFEMGEPLTVLTETDLGSLPATTAPALVRSLQDGLIAVVPGDVGGSPAWWTIDLGDGATRSILSPALGGVSWAAANVNPMPGYVRAGESVYVQSEYLEEHARNQHRRAGIERQLVENMVAIASIAMTAEEYLALANLFRAVGAAIAAGRFFLYR